MIDPALADALGAPVQVLTKDQASEFQRVFSQTRMEERESLYATARYAYTGEGEIWDLGCAAGGSSHFLGAGLRDRKDAGRFGPVKCFDLFDGYSLLCFGKYFPNQKNDLGIFKMNTLRVKAFLTPVQMNLVEGLPGYESDKLVEIAHIDSAKSLDLWKTIFAKLSSKIIPGKTLWIFQDFERARLPWQVYSLWELLKFGEILGGANYGTVYFKFHTMPSDEIRTKIVNDAFTLEERLDNVGKFFSLIRDKYLSWFSEAVFKIQDVESASLAYCYHYSGHGEKARALLASTSEAYRTQWSNQMYSGEIFGKTPK